MGFPGTNFKASNSGGVENITASLTVTPDDDGKTFMFNVVTGATATLPSAAAGKGCRVKFIVKLAATSNTYIITENTAVDTDKLCSQINELEVDTGDDGPSNATHTTITIGTTGFTGDYVDCFSDGVKWYCHGQAKLDGAIVLA